jgi:integrase
MASVYHNKKTGRIEVRAYGGINKIDGKKINLNHKPSLPLDASEDEIATAVRTMDKRANWCKGRKRDLTVGAVLEYRADKLSSTNAAPSTVRAYRSYIKCYIDPFIGELSTDEAHAHTFTALYHRLKTEGGKDGNPLSMNTMRKLHIFLRASFKDLVAEGLITHNPLDGMPVPPPENIEVMALCEEDFIALDEYLKASTEEALDAAILTALYSGAREGEVAGFRIKDFVQRDASLHVRKSYTKSEQSGKYELKDTKSRHNRRITIDDDTALALSRHIQAQRLLLASRGIRQTANTPLFSREDGTHHRPYQLYNRLKDIVAALGLDSETKFHTLRHTHATYLLMSGKCDVNTLSQRLGHYSPSITLDVYGHVMPGRDELAASVFAGVTKSLKEES